MDENGTPFAAVGYVELGFPHPFENLGDNDVVLKALVGETSVSDRTSPCLVEPGGRRAGIRNGRNRARDSPPPAAIGEGNRRTPLIPLA